VVLIADPALDTLGNLRYRKLYKAESGGPGSGNLKHGRRGQDLVLPVPLGTIASQPEGVPLGEVVEAGQRLTAARGGHGGRGNKHFATAVHRTPRFAEKGGKGEEREITLELRLLADVGLVGLPNAGKSTLLARASEARPKIADYAFTTLEPQLGVVEIAYARFVLADIPGLIAGAAEGAGLGDDFLRHIQRTAVLLHVIDGTHEDILADALQIQEEMRSFDPALLQKPQVIVVNKIDVPGVSERIPMLKKMLTPLKAPVFLISAETGEGVSGLMSATLQAVQEARRASVQPHAEAEFQVFRPLEESGYSVRKLNGKFVLEGPGVPDLVVPRDTTPWEYAGILRERLRRTRWRRALERAGVKDGDKVEVGGVEIEW